MAGGTADKLSSAERRMRRELAKSFDAAWKPRAKAAGWGYIRPTSFKQIGEWFVYVDPQISTERNRSEITATFKPFYIDDLISRIMGFNGLDEAPLSLRARGPHCLVIPMYTSSIERDGNLGEMIEAAEIFLTSLRTRVEALTLDDFIAFTAPAAGQVSANQVAALIMAGRDEEADALCKLAIAIKTWGGPARVASDGRMVSFFELAARWIECKKV
ncbi:hypothetical protein ACIQTU_11905 [Brevundimonas sp. NPDC090276]|uniref:hypothetical protein n=1 Tax=Brevundimonas sp. NPDC090276 TaxID=3363956 RepID=UPI003839DEC4